MEAALPQPVTSFLVLGTAQAAPPTGPTSRGCAWSGSDALTGAF